MKVILAFAANALANFAIGLLLARYLGPADYGLFALAISVAVMIQTVAFDWARLAAARFYSERVRTEDPAVRATLDAGLALLILAVTGAAVVLVLSGLTASLSPALTALSVAVAVANGLFDYSTALVRARFRDDIYARLIGLKNGLALVLTVGGAWWFGSARAALLGVTLSMVGSLLALRGRLIDPRGPDGRASRALGVGLFRYAMPVVLANLFYQSIPLVDRLVLARSFSLAESGEFSFAYDVGVRIVAALGSMLDVILFQLAVRADELHGIDHGHSQVGRNIAFVVAVLAPACAGLWLILPSFAALVVPPEFRLSFTPYLRALMPGLFCYGIVFFALHPVFQIARTTRPLIGVAFGASAANLLGVAFLPLHTGSFAVAQGLALAGAASILTVHASLRRPLGPSWRDLLGAIAATGIMAFAVSFVGRLADPGALVMMLQIVAGAVAYLGMALVLDLCGVRGLLDHAWLGRRSTPDVTG